jgi:hypothetical protein
MWLKWLCNTRAVAAPNSLRDGSFAFIADESGNPRDVERNFAGTIVTRNL